MPVSARASLFALETVGIKLGLEQIRALLEALGHPERTYPSLVVAGTNGKGSVTAMVERALRAAGYRTGRYISPHLVRLEERFAIDGQPISSSRLDTLAEKIMNVASGLDSPPSFFEATTALARGFLTRRGGSRCSRSPGRAARRQRRGLAPSRSRRWISTTSRISATRSRRSPRESRGDRAALDRARREPSPVCRICHEVATAVDSDLVYAADGVTADTQMTGGRIVATVRTPRATHENLTLALRGRHQVANAVTAIRLLEELDARRMFVIPPEAIRAGVEQVTWAARLELIERGGRQVLIDGAHNPAGARALASYILEVFEHPLPMVIGVMRDKDLDGLLRELAPAASHFVCTAARSSRAASPDELAEAVRRVAPGTHVSTVASEASALRDANAHGSTVVVAGSLYLAGEIRAELS